MGQLFILTEEEKRGHRNENFRNAKNQERFNNYSGKPVVSFRWYKIVSSLYSGAQNGGYCGRELPATMPSWVLVNLPPAHFLPCKTMKLRWC